MSISNSIQLKFDQKKMNQHYLALFNIQPQNIISKKKIKWKKNKKRKNFIDLEQKRENSCLMKNLKHIYFKQNNNKKYSHLIYKRQLYNNKNKNDYLYHEMIHKENNEMMKRINSATSKYSIKNLRPKKLKSNFKIKRKSNNIFKLDEKCKESFKMFKSNQKIFNNNNPKKIIRLNKSIKNFSQNFSQNFKPFELSKYENF